MTTFTTDNSILAGQCGCGRSPTGKCCGWHALNEEEYKKRKDAYDLAEYQKHAQSIWFEGGSCTGGNPE
jgi:hypothetical protein